MNFPDLMIRNTYTSYQDDQILRDLVSAAMPHTTVYRQVLSSISPEALSMIFQAFISMMRSHGQIMLLLTPEVDASVIQAPPSTEDGESDPDAFATSLCQAVQARASVLFSSLSDLDLKILREVLSTRLLVQVAVTSDHGTICSPAGMGIMTDREDHSFVFHGGFSAVLPDQYEEVFVFRDWKGDNAPYVRSRIKTFDQIWEHTHPNLQAFPIHQQLAAQLDALLAARSRTDPSKIITLRDYQQEAIAAWVANHYKGFYVMATGTGKTWTAIFSARRLLERENVLTVIAAPYKHLLRQWGEDLSRAFPESTQIFVSSENPGWSAQLRQAIIRLRYHPEERLIVISTIRSFYMPRFTEAISTYTGKKLLIVDEAHRFTQRPESLLQQYPFLLGLSATPYRGKSAESGRELMSFFGGQVYNLPIEKALAMKCLVPYDYHPIFVHSTPEEEAAFAKYTQQITTCFNAQGVCINPELLATAIRARLRVISMVTEKLRKLDTFLADHSRLDHFVVYCGDGKVMEDDQQEKRHISIVREMLNQHGYVSAQFTAQETMDERMRLITAFDQGIFSALAAIRCLDEGVNIPSIKSALIMSSNDDYREFVQRRGRILRTHKDKKFAEIYDLVVLPSRACPGMAAIELRRYAEYARLSRNAESLQPELDRLMGVYGLKPDDINVFDFDDEERAQDE